MILTEDQRTIKLKHFRKCMEKKLEPYGPGIDFGVKERFVDFGSNTILVLIKKGLTNITRTTKYEQIENMDDTGWVKEMIEAIPENCDEDSNWLKKRINEINAKKQQM